MTKEYSLDIENVGTDAYVLMSRGHHDIHDFMKKVREDYEWPLGVPKHVYIKVIPAPKNSGYRSLYSITEKPIKSGIPATYVWEAHGAQRYESHFPEMIAVEA